AQSEQFAPAKTGVHRGGPEPAVTGGQRRDQLCCFGRRGDSITNATWYRKLEASRRVDRDLAPCDGSAKDAAQRVDRVPDSGWVDALGDQVVHEVLDVRGADLGEAGAADLRKNVVPENLRVEPQRRRLEGG